MVPKKDTALFYYYMNNLFVFLAYMPSVWFFRRAKVA